MATSYKSKKSEKLKFSVLWILGFDDLQVTKIQNTQKLKEQDVDLSMAQINFHFHEFLGFWFFAPWYDIKPNPPISKCSGFEIWRFWILDFLCFKLRDKNPKFHTKNFRFFSLAALYTGYSTTHELEINTTQNQKYNTETGNTVEEPEKKAAISHVVDLKANCPKKFGILFCLSVCGCVCDCMPGLTVFSQSSHLSHIYSHTLIQYECLSVLLRIILFACQSVFLSACRLSVFLPGFVFLLVCLFVSLCVYFTLSSCPVVCLSVCLPVCDSYSPDMR